MSTRWQNSGLPGKARTFPGEKAKKRRLLGYQIVMVSLLSHPLIRGQCNMQGGLRQARHMPSWVQQIGGPALQYCVKNKTLLWTSSHVGGSRPTSRQAPSTLSTALTTQ